MLNMNLLFLSDKVHPKQIKSKKKSGNLKFGLNFKLTNFSGLKLRTNGEVGPIEEGKSRK